MSDDERGWALVDLHLPNYGEVHVRVLTNNGLTLDDRVQTALEYEQGWLTVERDNGYSASPRWQEVKVNLSHFATIAQTGVEPFVPASTTGSPE